MKTNISPFSLPLILCASLVLSGCGTAARQRKAEPERFREWGEQPPMGWNSWDCFGCTVTERLVEPSRCAAGLAASLTLPTCSSIPQPMSRNRTGFCSRSTNHWQYRLESAKSNPHFLPGV
jgi:hypothetical protein